MTYSIDALLAEARKHEGYLEKKTASKPEIYDKTANAGNKNYNMFALWFDEEAPNWQNGRKNTEWCGWCAIYVDYCFCQVFGQEAAQKLLCIPSLGKNNYSASPNMAENYFKAANRWFNRGDKNPQAGDVILFTNTKGQTTHIGLVTGCKNGKVYTIEGNTSSVAGMDANGGCCREKSYNLTYSRIKGYGRPDYGTKPEVDTTPTDTKKTPAYGSRTLRKGCKGDDVRELQRDLMNLGYEMPKYGADGDFGGETEDAVKKFQKDNGLKADGVVGEKTFAALETAEPTKICPTCGQVIK
jgi:hypothetical protein